MNASIAALLVSATVVAFVPSRSAQIELACESGCVSADSVLVANAIKAGLSRHGVTVTQQTHGRELPLLVTGRISVQGDTVRVAAEFLELQKEISRYTVRTPRTELSAQVQKMGERFGRAAIRP